MRIIFLGFATSSPTGVIMFMLAKKE